MRAKLMILDADYIEQDGYAATRLFCKDIKGGTVVVLDDTFKAYFYVLTKPDKIADVRKRFLAAAEKADLKVFKTDEAERRLGLEKKKFLKIFATRPADVSHLRDVVKQWEPNPVIEEYEYAISFYKRYMIDNSLSGMGWIEVEGDEIKADEYIADKVIRAKSVKPLDEHEIAPLKILSFDIEVIEERGENRIIMISIATSTGMKKVLTYQEDHFPKYVEVLKNEKALLERFVEIINDFDPDIVLGYNTDRFDFPIIVERAEALKVELPLSRDGTRLKFARRARITSARLNGRVHVDIFDFISTILAPQMQTEVMTLDAVSAEILGDRKIELEFEEIIEAWRKKKDLAKLAEYALKDSELVLRLSEVILPQIYELSRVVGQVPFDVARMTYGQLVEWYLSRRAAEMGEIIPTQPRHEEIMRRRGLPPFVGAFVKEPIPGLHEDIAVMDFRSLYPSIIASFNISPETYGCEHKTCAEEKVPDTKFWFCKKEKGFVPAVIKDIIAARGELKKKLKSLKPGTLEHTILDNRQYALKIIANATYGVFGFAGARWYCRECGESCTAYGRFYIQQVMRWAEEAGFVVVYGDSDSVFVKLTKSESIEKAATRFLNDTNERLPGIMELEMQGFYERGIFIPRGVGPGTAKKRYALIDASGKLTIRGLERVRRDWSEVARRTQEKVLRFILEKKDVEGAVKYVRKVIEDLRGHKIPLRELTIYEQLTKHIAEYKATSPHVVAAKKIKERGRPIGPGIVIMFAITKGKKGQSISQRAEPVEDIEVKDIDIDYYIGHQIVPAALRVLAVLGVTEDDLLGKAKQHGLMKYAEK